MNLRKRAFFTLFFALVFCSLTSAQEGELYELQSISFEGNHSISSSTLQDIIYSEETPWWFWKFLNSFTSLGAEPVYFDSTYISVDIESLREYYNANGFFNTQFGYDFEIDTSAKEVHLKYLISEGNPSNYSEFIFHGIDNLPGDIQKQFISEVVEDSTNRYNQNVIQSNINEGLSFLQNSGYMTSRFDSSIIFRDTSKYFADVHLFLSPGRRFKIDTVLIDKEGPGAPFISDQLLRDITGINRDEYYNLEKIRMGQARLFRTGLFNSINIASVDEDTSGNYVPILVQGNIGEMNELSPEIVMNNQQSAFNVGLAGTYTRKNFFGEARKLTLKASFGVQDLFQTNWGNIFNVSLRDTTVLGYVDTRLTIEQPYLFDKPILGIWETYATLNKQRDYNNTLYGSKLTFQFELPRYTAVNMLSTYYNLEISREVYHTNNDSLSEKFLSLIGTDFGKTTVDDILFPSKGYIVSIQLEEANAAPYLITRALNTSFNSSLFYRIIVSGSAFYALDERRNQIVGAKLKTGFLQPYHGGYAGIPINKTFYTGGSNSIRGWRSNELAPEDAPIVDEKTDLGVNVKGGTFLLEGSVELRQRFLENFGFAIFSDYGNTWLSYNDFRYNEIAIAVGTGLRYYTAFAPFRIDFGFKFYDPADKKFIFNKPFWSTMEFHFGIGEAF